MVAKQNKKMRGGNKVLPAIALLLLLCGIGIIAFPYLSQLKYASSADRGFDLFTEETAPLRSAESVEKHELMKYAQLRQEMQDYNDELYENKQAELTDIAAYQIPSFDLTKWGFEKNIVAYIKMPAIDLLLPVYLGANEANMILGAAHLSQTSLPIAGENTNSVICGHKGYSGAVLFDRILELEEGDEVIIINLWETLTYRVSGTTTIMSDEIDKLMIQDGKDMLSLFTCYYQQGRKDRYVVFCERSPEELQVEETFGTLS